MPKTFSDSEVKTFSFNRTAVVDKVTKECSISTSEIISTDQNTQTKFTRNVEIQTDDNKEQVQPKYNEEALLQFMRKMAPKVEEELRKKNKYFGLDFKQNLPDEEEVTTKKIFNLHKQEKLVDMKCHHISWNCYCNKIAVSFGSVKHENWCKHSSYILIYECDRNEEFLSEPKECLEVNTCIIDLKFHPVLSSVMIFATDEGKIFWHDITESLETNSKNYIYHKKAKIIQMSWINIDSSLYLATAGADGLLYFWLTSSFTEDWKNLRTFTFKSPEDVVDRGIQHFEFSKLNSEKFIVALEGGKLFYCSINSVSGTDNDPCYAVVSKFDFPQIVVSDICFSSFDENIFVISSLDHRLRVYHLNEKSPIYIIVTEYFPLGLEWSHLQEDVFMTWAADGKIRSYNYPKCIKIKTIDLDDDIFCVAFKVKGIKQLFAVANSESISIWQTTLFVR